MIVDGILGDLMSIPVLINDIMTSVHTHMGVNETSERAINRLVRRLSGPTYVKTIPFEDDMEYLIEINRNRADKPPKTPVAAMVIPMRDSEILGRFIGFNLSTSVAPIDLLRFKEREVGSGLQRPC